MTITLPPPLPALTRSPEWRALSDHHDRMAGVRMVDLFAADAGRFDRYHVALEGVLFDYSKHRVSDETLSLLLALARARGVEDWRDRMFAGAVINTSEKRAVLHTVLRRPVDQPLVVAGVNVMAEVGSTLDRMADFAERVRSGAWCGFDGRAITDVVNIGIGGSDLGPVMMTQALAHLQDGPRLHFVSNVDGEHLYRTVQALDPATTLFLIASKTFTTQETMANAAAARDWVLAAAGGDAASIAKHFVALSTNRAAVAAFGIDAANMFPFADWVGGRYSVWSSIGLAVMLAAGPAAFRSLLDGAYAADVHFRTAPLEQNIPVLMAVLGIWYRNFFGAETLAVLPYDQRLARFPAYLQQLDMESNGKRIDRDGHPVDYGTAPIVFGEAGTNGQHSFYQLIHQGTHLIPCDFIVAAAADHPYAGHHRKLLANALAQPQALMAGQDLAAAGGDVFRTFPGNTPSSFFLLDQLTPRTLGFLTVLYEHKVFVQGIIWNLNSFDQPGVELGKTLANALLSDAGVPDASTAGLRAALRSRDAF